MNCEFIIKSAITLALLYSLFFAFLSRETFHRFNRMALLGIMLTSLIVPLMHFTVSQPTIVQEAMQMPTEYLTELPVVQIYPTPREGTEEGLHLTWSQLLTYIYLAGVAVMVTILLVQTLSLLGQMQGGLRHTDERGNTVILKPGIRAPFSIFRYIVMSVDDYEQHRQHILTHEQEHIRLGHSYDLLLLEAMKVLQWFNPFIWFLGHDLHTLHEYEADEAVINQGIDAKQYQQLLVLKAVGNRLQPFANTLGRGSLKQRIIMMYQKKSNRWKMLKALLVIPTTGFALYAFATPEVLPEMQAVLEKELNLPGEAEITPPVSSEQTEDQGKIDPTPEVLAEYSGGQLKMYEFLSNNVKYPVECMELGIQGRVIMQFLVKADGAIEDIKPIAIGDKKGKNAKEIAELFVTARKKQAKDNDDAEVSEEELEGIRKGYMALMEESARVIKLMPKWKPAQTKGKPVDSQFTLPITFRLQ